MSEHYDHCEEHKLIQSFLAKGSRAQFTARLGNPKTRGKMTRKLAHFQGLDQRYATLVPRHSQNPEAIYRILKSKGAPNECYVISDDPILDGKRMSLHQILGDVVGSSFGVFLSCIPGKLAYFESEDMREIYPRAIAKRG